MNCPFKVLALSVIGSTRSTDVLPSVSIRILAVYLGSCLLVLMVVKNTGFDKPVVKAEDSFVRLRLTEENHRTDVFKKFQHLRQIPIDSLHRFAVNRTLSPAKQ